MEKLLNPSLENQVREALAPMSQDVEILVFTSKEMCQACEQVAQLLNEVVALSDKIHLQSMDLQEHSSTAEQYHVDNAPAIVIAAREGKTLTDYGIRILGTPAGHEFTTLIHDILMVSQRDSGLTPATRQLLSTLDEDIHLQVFVTPT